MDKKTNLIFLGEHRRTSSEEMSKMNGLTTNREENNNLGLDGYVTCDEIMNPYETMQRANTERTDLTNTDLSGQFDKLRKRRLAALSATLSKG